MSTAAAAASAGPEGAEKPKKKGKLLIILIAVVVLAAGGGAGAWFFFFKDRHQAGKPKEKEVAKAVPIFVNLEPFTVNLQADDQGDRYLQTEIVLEATRNELVETVKARMPVVRGGILLLLSSKQAANLTTVAGKQELATQIVAEVRKHLPETGGEADSLTVHFASFVIQ
jgi:flagellar protein FliL